MNATEMINHLDSRLEDLKNENDRLRSTNADLLEALEAINNYAGPNTHHVGCECGWVGRDGLACHQRTGKVRAAIAKAKGESK